MQFHRYSALCTLIISVGVVASALCVDKIEYCSCATLRHKLQYTLSPATGVNTCKGVTPGLPKQEETF